MLVGKQVLRFEVVTDAERERPARRRARRDGVRDARPAALGAAAPAHARGRQPRDVYHLARPEIVLGREKGDIIFPDDEFMSRRHAQLSLPQRRGQLEDLGSSNGTFLRLRGPHGLAPGDLIRLGDELLRFEIG